MQMRAPDTDYCSKVHLCEKERFTACASKRSCAISKERRPCAERAWGRQWKHFIAAASASGSRGER